MGSFTKMDNPNGSLVIEILSYRQEKPSRKAQNFVC